MTSTPQKVVEHKATSNRQHRSAAAAAHDAEHEWGYENDHYGPAEWAKLYSIGRNQSPINILVGDCDRLARSTCCGHAAQPKQMTKEMMRHTHSHPLDSIGELQRAHHHHHHQRSSSLASSTSSSSQSQSSSPSSSQLTGDDSGEESGGSAVDRVCAKFSSTNINGGSSSTEPSRKKAIERLRPQSQNTRYCTSNRKLFLGYPRYLSSMQLCNTGHTWQVNLPAELSSHTLLSGPPFGDREYRLAQLHCHWGEDCEQGSEHQINGRSFAAELHFVHWNCTDFDSAEEASKHKHGLAVLGVLVQALDGEQNRNRHLDKIVAGLKRIQKPGSSANIHARLDLKKLFPANRWAYASYEGSLTTPPLTEVVDWVVFLNPIQCSSSQVEQFRQIRCNETGGGRQPHEMIKNCRPVQPTNDRLVSIWTHH